MNPFGSPKNPKNSTNFCRPIIRRMGTEILRPRDFLPPASTAAHLLLLRNPNHNNSKPSRRPAWSPLDAKERREGPQKPAKPPAGHVTILRRGEPLDAFREPVAGVFELGRLGPEPVLIPRRVWTADRAKEEGVYAGCGFSASAPEPSALPLPNFWKRRDDAVDQTATRDLRRLLRLE